MECPDAPADGGGALTCTVDWSLSAAEYQSLFQSVPRSTLLQDPLYGLVAARLDRQRLRWGLVRLNGEQAGLVQILEARLFRGMLHGLILDRGPLWLGGYGDETHLEAFYRAFARQLPRRFGRRRRILPEWAESPQSCAFMRSCGYKRLGREGYRTFWLDLSPAPEALRRNLRPKWRNMLSKAEKAGIETRWDVTPASIADVTALYKADRQQRGYRGASPAFLLALAREYYKTGNLVIGRALLDGRTCSAILVLRHGRAATYQVGWNSDAGRQKAANNLLLWQACLKLKESGVDAFDLGGFSETHENGIRRFKAGLGGEAVTLAGQYL